MFMNKTKFRVNDRPYYGRDSSYEFTKIHSNTPEQYRQQMIRDWQGSSGGDGHDEMSVTVIETKRIEVVETEEK